MLALMLQGGCTYSETIKDGAAVTRGISFGVAPSLACTETPRRVRATSLGIEVGARSFRLGYASSDLVCLQPDGCAAIFFAENAAEANLIREVFPGLAAACLQTSDASGRTQS